MISSVSNYLSDVKENLRLDISDKREIVSELETHIEDKVRELEESGMREEEAVKICLNLLGEARLVAARMYEAHSQGTWRQALAASLPHVLFGMLFILNWWQEPAWLIMLLIGILSTVAYGWWKGKPDWLTTWLGYSLLPVVVAGLLLLYLPVAWSWLTIPVYVPLALLLVCRVFNKTLAKDWLYISLMLFPIPVILGWFVASEWMGGLPAYSLERLRFFAPWIGLSFLALGLAVVTFVRLRKRWLKIAVLFLTGFTTLVLVALYAWGRLELLVFLGLVLLMTGIFLLPAILENGLRTGRWGKVFVRPPIE